MKIKANIKKTMLVACLATLTFSGSIFAAADSQNESSSLDAEEVEYDMDSGIATAKGNVIMTKGNATVTGDFAEFDAKTKNGKVFGNVTATKEDMHMTANNVFTEGSNHMIAEGAVNGTKADKHFAGPRVEYFSEDEYVIIPSGGTISSLDGTFSADYMEGYMKTEHIIGKGNAHMVSPKNNMEAGGDNVDYYGAETGKAVLTGNAWAVQDNNTLKSKKLTVFLADDGKLKAAK